MKKILFKIGIFLISILNFTACNDEPDVNGELVKVGGLTAYVACAGNFGANNGTVGLISFDKNQNETGLPTYNDAYTLQNGRGIGDAQDVLVLGNKVFVTSTSSDKIEILDRSGKMEKRISLSKVQPRYLATDGTYVYFSAYSGKIYKLNPNVNSPLVDSVEVGSYPEAISIANGKLYANLSDYKFDNSGKSIAVVDLNSFKKIKDIEVALNPYNQSIAVGNNVYFVSNYHAENALVQKIDATTDRVSSVTKASAIAYNATNNTLVCLYSSYYDQQKRFFIFNLSTGTETDLDMTGLVSPQQVNVDDRGYIYVIDNPSYTAPSELFYYSPKGKLLQGHLLLGYSVQNIRFTR